MVWYKIFHLTFTFLTPGHWICSFVCHLNSTEIILQPFRRIELIIHIAITVITGTHFYLSQVKHLRVECLTQAHNIEKMFQYWGEKHFISLKILHQAGFETAWQAATKLHALTIATCPSLLMAIVVAILASHTFKKLTNNLKQQYLMIHLPQKMSGSNVAHIKHVCQQALTTLTLSPLRYKT